MLPNPLVGIPIAERWMKTYRKLHNLFINKELAHQKDVKKMIEDLNKRIDQLTQKVDQNFQTVQTTFASHTHNAPQAPAGVIPTTPPAAPMQLQPSTVPPTIYIDLNMKQEDAAWRAMGPALAPLATGTSPEAAQASALAAQQVRGEG